MKVLCIVQARMGSERLPGKVMKQIIGKPIVIHALDRLKKSKFIDEIVLATSSEEKEAPLVKLVEQVGYEVFRGEEDNVLKRYKDAFDKYYGDIIVRITGDCPLIDYLVVDNVISYFMMHEYDYVRLDVPENFIRGFDVEVFSKQALNRVYSKVCDIKSEDNTNIEINSYKEHVTLYMYRHPEEFNIGIVKGEQYYSKPYRLCVDTQEDFELVKNIYEHFNDGYVLAKDVVKYLDENIDIANINASIRQKHV